MYYYKTATHVCRSLTLSYIVSGRIRMHHFLLCFISWQHNIQFMTCKGWPYNCGEQAENLIGNVNFWFNFNVIKAEFLQLLFWISEDKYHVFSIFDFWHLNLWIFVRKWRSFEVPEQSWDNACKTKAINWCVIILCCSLWIFAKDRSLC